MTARSPSALWNSRVSLMIQTTPREAKIFRHILRFESINLHSWSGNFSIQLQAWWEAILFMTFVGQIQDHVIKEFGGTRNLAYRCTEHWMDSWITGSLNAINRSSHKPSQNTHTHIVFCFIHSSKALRLSIGSLDILRPSVNFFKLPAAELCTKQALAQVLLISDSWLFHLTWNLVVKNDCVRKINYPI